MQPRSNHSKHKVRQFSAAEQFASKAVSLSKPKTVAQEPTLTEIICKAESDFAEGRGVVLTIDQLRAMINEGAA